MQNLNIGDQVRASQVFERKCSDRFDSQNNLKPCKRNFKGFIVGKRNVIMSNFKYHGGGGYGEDYDPPYVSGKTEWVWLVARSLKHEPLIVRDCDVFV